MHRIFSCGKSVADVLYWTSKSETKDAKCLLCLTSKVLLQINDCFKWLTQCHVLKNNPIFTPDFWQDIRPSLFETLYSKSCQFCFLGFRDESICVTMGPSAVGRRCMQSICMIFDFLNGICLMAVSGCDQSSYHNLPAFHQQWDITPSTRKMKSGANLCSKSRSLVG